MRGWKAGDRVVSETAAVIDADSPLAAAGALQSRSDAARLRRGRRWRDASLGAGAGANSASGARSICSFEKAALTEPCCVAYNAVVNNGRIKPGDRILVLGPGPIGLLCAAMARLQGAIVGVVGLERDRPRLEIAEQYGCEALVGGRRRLGPRRETVWVSTA